MRTVFTQTGFDVCHLYDCSRAPRLQHSQSVSVTLLFSAALRSFAMWGLKAHAETCHVANGLQLVFGSACMQVDTPGLTKLLPENCVTATHRDPAMSARASQLFKDLTPWLREHPPAQDPGPVPAPGVGGF